MLQYQIALATESLSCHFEEDQFENIPGRRKLRPNAVPRVFPTHTISASRATNVSALVKELALSPQVASEDDLGRSSECRSTLPVDTSSNLIVILSNNSTPVKFELQSDGSSESPRNSSLSANEESTRKPVENTSDKSHLDMCIDAVATNQEYLDVNCKAELEPEEELETVYGDTTEDNVSDKLAIECNQHLDLSVSHDSFVASEERQELRQKVFQLKRQLYLKQKECDNLHATLRLFNSDQIKYMNGKKISKWSKETTQKALEMKQAVGSEGYRFLRSKLKWPLPAYSTLCKYDDNSEQLNSELREEEMVDDPASAESGNESGGDGDISALSKTTQSENVKTHVKDQDYQCILCLYKTVHKSLMIYHLRTHVKADITSHCDFC
uniref:C2H2-type domain-containing protein n=1 Tax=Timema shepardi TaxID=629360 RepID=A0A7R9B7D5_TIMSH|nr:unnamed protein product [Timema shepardi]